MEIDMSDKAALVAALLDKYMEGDTSNEEEALLRQYFNKESSAIPNEWRIYKALFGYEKEEREKVPTAVQPARRGAAARRRMRIAGLMSAAASVAVLVCVLLAKPSAGQDYAMIDGKKHTSRQVVMREAEEALLLVSSNEDDTFGALEQMQ